MNFNAKFILAKKNAKLFLGGFKCFSVQEAHVCLNASYKGTKRPGYKQGVNQ